MDAFIEKYDPVIPKSQLGVLGGNNTRYRVAEGIWIHEKDLIADRFKHIVAGVTGLPIDNQETPHLIKYTEGGEYKEHWDYFLKGESYYEQSVAEGGQRVFSSILYLNDNFEGGETDFPKQDFVVKPKTGSIFTWRNINVDGTVKEDSLHAGLPVTKGIKYILIIWIRENEIRKKTKPTPKVNSGIKFKRN